MAKIEVGKWYQGSYYSHWHKPIYTFVEKIELSTDPVGGSVRDFNYNTAIREVAHEWHDLDWYESQHKLISNLKKIEDIKHKIIKSVLDESK